jgi:hypothetical protein
VADSFTMPSNQVAMRWQPARAPLRRAGPARRDRARRRRAHRPGHRLPLRGGRARRRVHRHCRGHGGVPRDRDHPRSPSARRHAGDARHRRGAAARGHRQRRPRSA